MKQFLSSDRWVRLLIFHLLTYSRGKANLMFLLSVPAVLEAVGDLWWVEAREIARAPPCQLSSVFSCNNVLAKQCTVFFFCIFGCIIIC